jgi:hypothetical protein
MGPATQTQLLLPLVPQFEMDSYSWPRRMAVKVRGACVDAILSSHSFVPDS